MNQESHKNGDELWRRLVESHVAKALTFQDFFAPGVDRVALVRRGLFLPRGESRATAIELLRRMTVSEQLQLFPELINLARAAHGPVGAIRDLILGLPREWVLANIEREVEPLLKNEEYDDYWMFLELYELLDRGLTIKLARRAASHPDPDIREKGEDYLEKRSEPQLPAPMP